MQECIRVQFLLVCMSKSLAIVHLTETDAMNVYIIINCCLLIWFITYWQCLGVGPSLVHMLFGLMLIANLLLGGMVDVIVVVLYSQ